MKGVLVERRADAWWGEVGRMILEKKVFDQVLHKPQESVLPPCPISFLKWRRDAKKKPHNSQQD